MIRNYKLGDFESLDMTITDSGSDQIKLRYDGLEGCAFSDLELYSDSGRTTALSVSDWEYYTKDTNKSDNEATTDGSGKTIYKEIRILNPTYQTGSIYATFNNFGTYPDGDVLGIDYIVIDADYAFTTVRNLMTYLVIEDGLTDDITITVTDSGFDERSRFKVVNKDSTYKVIVQDGTELEPYRVSVGQSVEFYDVDTSLVWANGGWENIYLDTSSTTFVVFDYGVDTPAVSKPVTESMYKFRYDNGASGQVINLYDITETSFSDSFAGTSNQRTFWSPGTSRFEAENTSRYIYGVWMWHDPK